MNFEKDIARIEEIVRKMEAGDLTLEDSLKFFEEGVKLSQKCQAELEAAEQKVNQLVSIDQKTGAIQTKPFEET